VPTKVEVYPIDETNKEIFYSSWDILWSKDAKQTKKYFILVEIFCETKMQSKQRNIYSSWDILWNKDAKQTMKKKMIF
jgi:hypothetical protein